MKILFHVKWVFKKLFFFLKQADFLEDNMGSINMKGFVTSLQKKGKLHHSILVEQVRVMWSNSEYSVF